MTKRRSIFILAFVAILSFMLFLGCSLILNARADTFYMIEGASVRLTGENGIRFTSKIDENEKEAEYHMMIIPESFIATYNLGEGSYYEDLEKSQYAGTIADMICEPYEDAELGWCIRGSLVGLKYNNVNRKFIGIAYKAIRDDSGEIISREYVTKNIDKTARSIINVISRFMNMDDITNYSQSFQDYCAEISLKSYNLENGVTEAQYNSGEGKIESLPTVSLGEINIDAGLDGYQLSLKDSIENAQVVYESANSNIAKVSESGFVEGVSQGTTTITAKYLGQEYTATVNSYEVVDGDFLSDEVDFINDTSFNVVKNMTGTLKGVYVDNIQIDDGAGKVNIADINNEDSDKHVNRIKEVSVRMADLRTYLVTINAVGHIYSEDDLSSMYIWADKIAGVDGDWTFGGKWCLERDIALSGEYDKYYDGQTFTEDMGFVGEFDGKGHTISNVKSSVKRVIYASGLFGVIGKEGVVKNIRVELGLPICDGNSGALCSILYGTIQDVYVSGSMQKDHSDATGGVVGYIKPGATLKNIISNVQIFYTEVSYDHMAGIGAAESVNFNAENCYYFSTNGLSVAGCKLAMDNAFILHPMYGGNGTGIDSRFNNVAAIVSNTNEECNYIFSRGGFDTTDFAKSGAWIVNGSNMPIFKASEDTTEKTVVTTELNVGTVTEFVYSNGGFIKNANMFDGTTLSGSVVGIYGSDGINYLTDDTKTCSSYSGEYFTVETTTHIYTNVKFDVVSAVITNKAEFEAMFTTADTIAGTVGDSTYGGYWVLGNDIVDFGSVTRLADYSEIFWKKSLKEIGWVGTFDGRGHTISGVNFQIEGCGLFGSIGVNGVVKNLTIDCPTFKTTWTGLIGAEVWGTVENIRLIVETTTNYWDGVHTYGILTKGIRDGATIKNVFVEVSAGTDYATSFFTLLGDVECDAQGTPLSSITIKDCYGLGYFKNAGVGGQGCPGTMVGQYGAISYASAGDKTGCFTNNVKTYIARDWGFASAAALFIAGENDLSSFDTDIWNVDGYNIPTMKTLETIEEIYSEDNTKIELGEMAKLIFNDGSFVGNNIVISSPDFSGNIIGVYTADGTLLSDSATIPYENIASLSGNVTLHVKTSDKVIYTNVSVSFIDGIITNKAEFEAMFATADTIAGTVGDSTYGGYWILGNDITNFGSVTRLADYSNIFWNKSLKDIGWVGTFDGRGHTISGVNFQIEGCGLFGSIGVNGVVKNLTIDCPTYITTWTGLIGAEVWGTVENIRLIVETTTNYWDGGHTYGILTKGIRDGATIKNVFVEVSAGTDYATSFFTLLGDVECDAQGTPLSTITIEDCYGLGYFKNAGVGGQGCPGTMVGQYGAISYASAGDKTSYFTNNVKTYIARDWGFASAAALFIAGENDLSSFDTSVWTIDGYKVPVMKEYEAIEVIEDINNYTEIDLGIFNTNFNTFRYQFIVNDEIDGVITAVYNGETKISDNYMIDWVALGLSGDLTLKVITDKAVYVNVKVCVVNGIITNKAEFDAMFTTADTLAGTVGDSTYGGYWILGNDITNFGSVTRLADYSNIFWNKSLKEIGWVGTFDGRGHTISGVNFQIEGCGLFGSIGVNGVVKNLTIDCPTYITTWTGLIGAEVWGTVENIRLIVETTTNYWDGGHTYGILTKGIRDGATIKNVFVEVSAQTDYATSFFTLLGDVECDAQGTPLSSITIKDCYGLGYFKNAGVGGEGCPGTMVGQYGAISYASAGDKTGCFTNNVKTYIARDWGFASAAALFIAGENDLSSFDTSVWTIDGYKVPVMKNAGACQFTNFATLLHDVSIEESKTINLIDNGLSDYVIVLPLDATDSMKETATKLQTVIREATGANLPIVGEYKFYYSNTAKCISIGETWFSDVVDVDYEKIGKQGYYIKTVDNSIFIKAGGDEGIYYGVIKFLEEVFGYEFYAVDEIYYNTDTTVALPILDIVEKPDMYYREAGFGEALNNPIVEIGYKYTNANDTYFLGRDIHNSFTILPPDTYRETNPTWYAYYGAQLCYSNPEMKAQYIENLKLLYTDYIENNGIKAFNEFITFIGAEDSVHWCRYTNDAGKGEDSSCPYCKSVLGEYGYCDGNDPYNGEISYSILMTRFVNDVESAINSWLISEYEGAEPMQFYLLAFQKTSNAPIKDGVPVVTLNDNVGVYFCFDGAFSKGVYGTEINKKVMEYLNNWAKLTDKIMIYDYPLYSFDYLVPYNFYTNMQNNFRVFANMNVKGLFNQTKNGQNLSSGFSRLQMYLESKLLWNVNSDVEALTDEFFANYFKDASANMRTYFDGLMAKLPAGEFGLRLDNISDSFTYAELSDWLSLFNDMRGDIAKYNVGGANENIELYNNLNDRIALEEMSVRYMMLYLYGNDYAVAVGSDVQTLKTAFETDFAKFRLNTAGELREEIWG